MRFQIPIFFIASILSFYVEVVRASVSEKEVASVALCRNSNVVRTLRVQVDKEGNACETVYTKAGQDRVIGQGRFTRTCSGFKENVKDNLEKAGWRCQEINRFGFASGVSD